MSFAPVTYWIPASRAIPLAPTFDICSEIIFTDNPPYILFEKICEYASEIFINLGEYVPIPPSGKSTVVISISPKFIFITARPKTPDSPTFWAKPNVLILLTDELASNILLPYCNQDVCVKINSVFSVNAKPATLEYIPSTPLTPATLAPAQPEVLAHGLINSSDAPAWPALCSFPA